MSLPAAFLAAIEQRLPQQRLFDDPLSTLTFGTDASFYRLLPKLVIRVESEAEVVFILQQASLYQVPVTFRAAGTSLSGQAISDSVLIVLGDHWNAKQLLEDGRKIRLQPGVIGAQANAALAYLQRKIGPDPASINAAKIGGIVANNSSGMCCGTAQNSYHTLAGMRLVLADGSILDTESETSRQQFRHSHQTLLAQLAQLATETKNNQALANKIRHKYRLKNTTGLSLNALIDFTDPLDILMHLLVGSEGTLGFVSSVTYHTVPDYPHKAVALVVFPDIDSCCQAVVTLKQQPVSAVELLDRRSLRSVQFMPGMPTWIQELSESACALLIESNAPDQATLTTQLEHITDSLASYPQEQQVTFTQDPSTYQLLWRMRKDTFPAVGAVRENGTTVIIEDVTFPLEVLAQGVKRLLALLDKHQYDEAILFGHALEGNLHFVFTQRFDSPAAIARYSAFMQEVSQLVAVEFGGALKAEHGTGRNMAPFVELEWGHDAYQLMWQIKYLLDPLGILNPDVVLSKDPQIHLKHLKPLPEADPIVDKCIECGFCEPVCPSNGLTLTPRQRIVAWRDIQQKKRQGQDTQALEAAYQYQAIDSCAATGLCAQRCPVGINTGELMRQLRTQQAQSPRLAHTLARHFSATVTAVRWLLTSAELARKVLGAPRLNRWSIQLHQRCASVPVYLTAMPTAAKSGPLAQPTTADSTQDKVVYFSSCVASNMGPSYLDPEQTSLPEKTLHLLNKAGFEVILPEQPNSLCCGQPFASKGYPEQAQQQLTQLALTLLRASQQGKYPIYCDTSPCSLRLIQQLADPRLAIYDSPAFLRQFVLPKLNITRQQAPISLHITCSSQHLAQSSDLLAIAQACAEQVIVPEGIYCCGFAGDKGFTVPELNQHALRNLASQVEGCQQGFSSSRTCEIGLSSHSGLSYQHLVYLLDKVSQPL